MAISKEKEQEYRDWVAANKQQDIDENYGGSEEKYYEEIFRCRRELLHWDEIRAYAQVLPHIEGKAQEYIVKYLGYLPRPCIYLRHEVYLRSLIDDYEHQRITEEQFNFDMEENIKHIRNEDMEKEGWADVVGVNDLSLKYYNTHFVEYKDQARNRLTRLIGSEPNLEDSLHAELILREMFAEKWFHDNLPLLESDYKAITVVAYRYIKRKFGKHAADTAPLL